MHAETATADTIQKTWNTQPASKQVDLTSHPTKSVNLQFCHLQWKSVQSFTSGCTLPSESTCSVEVCVRCLSCHKKAICMTVCYGNRTASHCMLHQLPILIIQASTPPPPNSRYSSSEVLQNRCFWKWGKWGQLSIWTPIIISCPFSSLVYPLN
jgi:hypothetical protein